eukprot:613898-Rhodomonas_salina.1
MPADRSLSCVSTAACSVGTAETLLTPPVSAQAICFVFVGIVRAQRVCFVLAGPEHEARVSVWRG